MNERTERVRRASLDAAPVISPERACLLTAFYRRHEGRLSVPMLRAGAFCYLCEHKTIYLGEEELIVGERGPAPKTVPTYPELTCHSLDDLKILGSSVFRCREPLFSGTAHGVCLLHYRSLHLETEEPDSRFPFQDQLCVFEGVLRRLWGGYGPLLDWPDDARADLGRRVIGLDGRL